MRKHFFAHKFITLNIIVCLCLVSPACSQTYLTDTIYTTFNQIIDADFDGNNHFAWRERIFGNSEIVQYYNGLLDTLFVNPQYHNCNDVFGVHVTAESVLWSKNDISDPNCNNTFIWNDGSISQNQFGFLKVSCSFESLLNTWDQNVGILDLDNQVFIPYSLQDASFDYQPSNMCSFNEDIIWLKAFKYDIGTQNYVSDVIIEYDTSTNLFQIIYETSNALELGLTGYSDKLVFYEELNDDTYDIYYYDGAVQLVTNSMTFRCAVLNDGVVYKQAVNNSPIFYWSPGNGSSVLHPNATIYEVSKCYVSYVNVDLSNFPIFKNELFITNGTSTESVIFNGLLKRLVLDGNNFMVVVDDNNNTNRHRVIKGRHNLSCSDFCPDDMAIVPKWDSNNYLNTRTTESMSKINLIGNVQYEASESISLISGFEVNNGAVFMANIIACP